MESDLILIEDSRNASIHRHYILMVIDTKKLKLMGWLDKPEITKEVFLSDKSSEFKNLFSERSWTHFAYINKENKLISETVIKIL